MTMRAKQISKRTNKLMMLMKMMINQETRRFRPRR